MSFMQKLDDEITCPTEPLEGIPVLLVFGSRPRGTERQTARPNRAIVQEALAQIVRAQSVADALIEKLEAKPMRFFVDKCPADRNGQQPADQLAPNPTHHPLQAEVLARKVEDAERS